MNMENKLEDHDYTVVYSGDETDFRKKEIGLTLIDQLELSVSTLRKNWSARVRVVFIHTQSLSSSTAQRLSALNIEPVYISFRPIAEFPIANKLNVGRLHVKTPYILFLDCDTIIHQPVQLVGGNDILIAYDALLSLPRQDMTAVEEILEIPPIQGKWPESPAFEYYNDRASNLVPSFNSGVILVRTEIQQEFYNTWEAWTKKLFPVFQSASWNFYIEQLACCMTVFHGKWNWGILPKGYNFICTVRAPFLRDWPKNQVVIEHYAGNNSTPSTKQG